MKSLKLTFCCLLFASFLFTGCADGDKDAVRSKARQAIPEAAPVATPPPATASTNPGVAHYICANNCEGSGGDSQGNCPVCGNPYEHNAAFHNNPANAPTTTPTSATTPGVPPITPPAPEPAQNAAGVWHYTCANGCAGGGGAAGPCGTCGGELAHNTAYHN